MTKLTPGSNTVGMNEFLKEPGTAAAKSIAEGGPIDAKKLVAYLRIQCAPMLQVSSRDGPHYMTTRAVGHAYKTLADRIEGGWRP